MLDYREYATPPHLSDAAECCWSMTNSGKTAIFQRVLPDGCADILFIRSARQTSLVIIGAMTKFEDFEVRPTDLLIGIRFRPGMWRSVFGIPGNELTDQSLALEDFWGVRARDLQERIDNASIVEESVSILASSVPAIPERTRLEKAFACIETTHGCVDLDAVASQAGLSARQFRRVCADRTGLSPKVLAQVLRFRRASSLIRRYAGDHAGLSVDCGYFDQSHLIAEFQRFSGRTPGDSLK